LLLFYIYLSFLLLADLNTEGQEYLVAEGGPGGHPGNSFLGKRGEIRRHNVFYLRLTDNSAHASHELTIYFC
jgi:hypothetical protein